MFYYLKESDVVLGLEQYDVCRKENHEGLEVNSGKVKVKILRTQEIICVPNAILEPFEIKDVGDSSSFKICDRCYKYLSSKSFVNNRSRRGEQTTRRPSCIKCRAIKDGISLSGEQKKKAEEAKKAIGELLVCPICLKLGIWGIKKFVPDHDHATGKFRGIICESCNTGLGRFDDKIDILEKAIEWLKNAK